MSKISRREYLTYSALVGGVAMTSGCLGNPKEKAAQAADEWVNEKGPSFFANNIVSALSKVAPVGFVNDELSDIIADYLELLEWQRGIIRDSGSGFHMVYYSLKNDEVNMRMGVMVRYDELLLLSSTEIMHARVTNLVVQGYNVLDKINTTRVIIYDKYDKYEKF